MRHNYPMTTSMKLTAFNILRYDLKGEGALVFHIDMVKPPPMHTPHAQHALAHLVLSHHTRTPCLQDFFPEQRFRVLMPLRAGPERKGGVGDVTMWRSLSSARGGLEGFLQPDLPSREGKTSLLATPPQPLCSPLHSPSAAPSQPLCSPVCRSL